ncbi:MAG: hypothetical protein KAI53_04680 [Candidatus Aenigmarchaeota archaeon]|nr:hypothetical protein [Candidatus Aenigmarchaeota archaeon]
MDKLKHLEKEIHKITQRNSRIETDKACEASRTRRFIVVILTYFVIVAFFFTAGPPKPFTNSIVPALAFVLSTLSLSFFKKLWLKRIYKK